ncbi:hypothetical protein [Aromatoleum anaerobium]|uniref:Uncharacterized protein n=1 Tax=Aromatoleum anaerobium TaxID=182180 RepID=A0ABX1PJ35_9RHOO|nr:hypothetical protein [Aromatoleum anaerobium]MCK0508973.1 hypothetical protein [Aromatoleum anaerobium]
MRANFVEIRTAKPHGNTDGSATKVPPAVASGNRRAFPVAFFAVAGYPHFIVTQMRLG